MKSEQVNKYINLENQATKWGMIADRANDVDNNELCLMAEQKCNQLVQQANEIWNKLSQDEKNYIEGPRPCGRLRRRLGRS